MYALVDGNNFYVSCERVFQPALRGRPVVVLSNNDGCAISRSDEAKDLGIRMGAPWFRMRALAEREGVTALSANFVLYGDMSDRMMSIAAQLGPQQEIYSIDESFVALDGVAGDLAARGRDMRVRIEQWTGIPCGIGIGRTKTLAKLANYIAKAADRKPGTYPAGLAHVCNLAALPAADLDAVLAATPARAVWGVGPQLGAQLAKAGITSVLQLARLDVAAVRKRWSVVLERTVRELQGMPCLGFDDVPPARHEISCTRTFGRAVTGLPGLLEAATHFASRAAEKLRAQGSVAGQVHVFVRTSPHRSEPQYSQGVNVPLRRPTSDTTLLVRAAASGMRAIYREGFRMVKAGVILMDLQDGGIRQGELALDAAEAPNRRRLMATLDSINARHGQGTLQVAGAGIGDQREWRMLQERLTPQYTTRWEDVPVARA